MHRCGHTPAGLLESGLASPPWLQPRLRLPVSNAAQGLPLCRCHGLERGGRCLRLAETWQCRRTGVVRTAAQPETAHALAANAAELPLRRAADVSGIHSTEPGLLMINGLYQPGDFAAWAARLEQQLAALLTRWGGPGAATSLETTSPIVNNDEHQPPTLYPPDVASQRAGDSGVEDNADGIDHSASCAQLAAEIDAFDSDAGALLRVSKYVRDFHPEAGWREAAAGAEGAAGALLHRLFTSSALHRRLEAAAAQLLQQVLPFDEASCSGLLAAAAQPQQYAPASRTARGARLVQALLRKFERSCSISNEAAGRIATKRKELESALQVRERYLQLALPL